MIDTPPRVAPPSPPVIERPAAHQVSYGLVVGRAARGARRLVVRIDGRIARKLRLTRREFRLDLDLPTREVDVRVDTVDASGRRVGTTVASVFGLPRSARPRIRLLRPEPRLQAEVGRLAAGLHGSAGVYVENLGTGAGAAWNARATFPAASTLKLAVAVAVLSRSEGPPRAGSPLDRLIRTMLDASDNEAANRLLIDLGGSTSAGGHVVDAVMRSIGLERTVMYGGYILGTSLAREREIAGRGVPLDVVEQPAWGIGKSTTALDLARLHRAVWLASGGLGPLGRGRSGVSPAEARYLLYLLAHVGDRAKLGRLVSRRHGLVLLHKAGWIDAARHDAGVVVWRGGIFVAAVMTYDGSGAGTRSDVLAGRVAQAALRQFSG